ncbi:MAG: hypothetical protein OEZ04_07125 [Nitrospinota bacterium]|nr:hypothetical protein [Nitrospinota bacterium]
MMDTLLDEEYFPLLEKVRSVSSKIASQTSVIRENISRWRVIPRIIAVEVKFNYIYSQIVQIDAVIEKHMDCSKESPCNKVVNPVIPELKDIISASAKEQQSLIELEKKAGISSYIISIQEKTLSKYEDLLENYMFVGDSEANELMDELAELVSQSDR